jgi:transposase
MRQDVWATFGEHGVLKIEELVMLLDLQRQGLSVSAIAEQVGLDRKTVRKYLRQGGSVAPQYSPRLPRPCLTDPFKEYLSQRLALVPLISATRLHREIKELGYLGGHTAVSQLVRQLRPPKVAGFEVRFETPPGAQAQVDFAEFKVSWAAPGGLSTRLWLFSLVLGHSRYLWGRFVLHQDLPTLIDCHEHAFTHLGGVPRQILYDQMRAVVSQPGHNTRGIVYNPKLLALAAHYGFTPKACRPYRAKTKGKVERAFRYIREDFFLGRQFLDLADLNAQWDEWLTCVAHQRKHGSTGQIVAEHFASERAHLRPLPHSRLDLVLSIERRVSSDGLVSVGGNYYSVPDGTARQVSVETTACEVRILDGQRLVAIHPRLTGRRQHSVLPIHRHRHQASLTRHALAHQVAQRPMAVYDWIGSQMSYLSPARLPGASQ